VATAPTKQVSTKSAKAEEQGDRRELLLEGALRVTAKQGLRALTHRAVEAEAGVPHGSTTYYFGTRQDLIVALIEHLRDKGRAEVEPIARGVTMMLADRSKPVDIALIAEGIVNWFDSQAEMELARFELQIAGARDPELKALMTECSRTFVQMCEPVVIACGSKNPPADARMLQSALDGWLIDRLTHEDPQIETITDGLRRLLESFSND
jgi:DNA-binding transcriptional regulator YbjK